MPVATEVAPTGEWAAGTCRDGLNEPPPEDFAGPELSSLSLALALVPYEDTFSVDTKWRAHYGTRGRPETGGWHHE